MTEWTLDARLMAEHEHEIHMEKFETMLRREIHPELAVAAAMHYCAKHGMPTPQWLAIAATKLLCRLLGNHPKKRGRAVSPRARYTQDMIDWERSDVFCETREKQVEVKQHLEILKKIPSAPRVAVQKQEKLHEWVGEDLLHAYECASMRLQITDAHAGADAMKKSDQAYQRRAGGRISGLRYYQFDRGFLDLVGIKTDFPRRGNKGVPLYSLTP